MEIVLLTGLEISVGSLLISAAFTAAGYIVQYALAAQRRIKQGSREGDLFFQSAEEGSPLNEIYGAASGVATPLVEWQEVTNVTVGLDNSLEKTGGVDLDNDAGATSEAEIPDGNNFAVAWNLGTDPEGRTYCGLMPTSSTVLDTDDCPFGFLVSSTSHLGAVAHTFFVFELGVEKWRSEDDLIFYTPGDTLAIARESGRTRYFHKGRLVYTSAATYSGDLKFSALIATSGSTVNDVRMSIDGLETAGGIKAAGTIIWATQPRKVETTEDAPGGKGLPSPKIEKTTYYTDLMVAFGRGRLRLKKVFFNADLVLNLDDLVSGASDNGASGDEYEVPPDPSSYRDRVFGFLYARGYGDSETIAATLLGDTQTSLTWYSGGYEQPVDATYQADVGIANAPAYRGKAVLKVDNLNISKYGGVPTILIVAENIDHATAEDICMDLCERAGLEPQDYDFSDLSDVDVRGLARSQPQSPRASMDAMALAYHLAFHESVDGQIVGAHLNQSPTVDIPEEHWGFVEGDVYAPSEGQLPPSLTISLDDPSDLPKQVSITTYNPLNNHSNKTMTEVRGTGPSEQVEAITFPLTMSPDETRIAARRLLYRRHIEQLHGSVVLPWAYGYLDPNDIFTAERDGITYRLRLEQIAGSLPGPLATQSVGDEVLEFELPTFSVETCETSELPSEPYGAVAPEDTISLIMEFDWTDNPFTIALWVKFAEKAGGTIQTIVSSETTTFGELATNGWMLGRRESDNALFFSAFNTPTYGSTIPNGEWVHVAATFAPGSAAARKVYLNGVLDIETTADQHAAGLGPFLFFTGINGFFISGYYGGLVGGGLTGCNCWTRVLSDEEVMAEYEGRSFIPCDTTDWWASWPLDNPSYNILEPVPSNRDLSPNCRSLIQSFGIQVVAADDTPELTLYCGDEPDDENTTINPSRPEAIAFFADTVALRDGDASEAGVYVGVGTRNSSFRGAGLYKDDGGYRLKETFETAATVGVLDDSVTITNTTDFDDDLIITVRLYEGQSLESSTDADVLNGANAAVVGDGHVIQFVNAEQVDASSNTWELTRILAGRRGSDFDLSHAAGEQFMLLNGAVKFVTYDLSERDVARNWKAVELRQSVDDADYYSFTPRVRTLLPLSVVDVEGSRDMSDNLTITWIRRTRISGGWNNYTDVPVAEESLAFEIDIYDGVDVVRTISATTTSASYSAADQTADFGSPQASIDIKIYQISARVGRGFERAATV